MRSVVLTAVFCIVHGAVATTSSSWALTVDTASVALNPKKTDAFAVKGRLAGLAAGGDVRIEFGDFTQMVPAASFATKKGKLTFKAGTGVPGLATVTIDTVKGKFAVTAKGLTLGAVANPAPFRLATGGFDECATVAFTESKGKRKLTGAVPACGFQGHPRIDPPAVLVGTPIEIRIRIAVRDDLALDLSSLVLLPLDDALQPVGGPLCALHDDGSAANGDDVAADGVFSCTATLTEPAPARIRVAVQARRDTVLVLSPSAFVRATNPLTDDEIQTVIDGQHAAAGVWESAVASVGDGPKALKQAVAGILDLPGVANAGITGDGASIFIEYASGVEGGLDLDPEATTAPPPAVAAVAGAADRSSVAQRTLAAAPAITSAAVSDGPHVGFANVLIWSPFYGAAGETYLTQMTDTLAMLFAKADCPKFGPVDVLKGDQCTLDSIATFPDYGTVVLITHGAQPHAKGDVALMSGEKATLKSQYYTFSTALSLGQLLIYTGVHSPEKKDYFVVFPAFVEQSFAATGKRFPNSVVYDAACTGAANKTFGAPFLAHGALAYLGMTDLTHGAFDVYASELFFRGMIQNTASAADALAAIPHRVVGGYFTEDLHLDPQTLARILPKAALTSKLVLVPGGDPRVTYACEPPPPGLVDTISVPVSSMGHAVGQVALDPTLHYRLEVSGMTRLQLDADFSDFDAFYCFAGSAPGGCDPPFPEASQLQFATQIADETPLTFSLQNGASFTGNPFPAYQGGHTYSLPFTGVSGKIWVATWPFLNLGTGETLAGAFTVRVFRE